MTGGQMQLNSTGKDQYEFRMYRQSIWFGVKDNLLYISNNERLADEAGRRYGVSLQNTPWAGQVTKNRFFMAFNAAQLVKDVQENPRLTRMLGSDAAIEAADIVLMDDDPAKISLAMRISRKCMSIAYQNIVFALAVKALCLILTALGITNMWWGVFADVGVMVLAVLNATRMLNVKQYQ